MPEFHGRIVDARTGAPIAGAIVKRRLYEAGPIGIGDGSRPLGVMGGDSATRSDADGRFILPPFGPRRYTGMGWLVYKPAWMPAYACYSEAGWAFGGCSGFGLPGNDPWTSATFIKSGNRVTFEVRVFPPTLEGVTFRSYNTYKNEWVTYTPTPEDSDPWGHYFQRLNVLSTQDWLAQDLFVKATMDYLHGREITEGMLLPLTNLSESTNPHLRPDLASERCLVLAAVARFCAGPARTKQCDWPTVELCTRDYLEDCGHPRSTR